MAEQRPDRVSVPTLVVTGGPLDGTTYELPASGDCVIGSSMDANVQILLGNVEPFHARVAIDAAGSVTIADAGSATGTFVNGERVEGEHPLREGDRICLGPPGAKGSAKMLVCLPGDQPGATTSGNLRDFGLELGEAASAVFDGAAAAEVVADPLPFTSTILYNSYAGFASFLLPAILILMQPHPTHY